MADIVWVDFPVLSYTDKEEPYGQFLNAVEFKGPNAKKQAVRWLREMFGEEAVDEDGRITTLSFGIDYRP